LDWPITYQELERDYTEAETLYGASGSSEDDFGPLQKPRHGFPHPSILVQPINQRLMTANRAKGLKPFRLPLAIGAEAESFTKDARAQVAVAPAGEEVGVFDNRSDLVALARFDSNSGLLRPQSVIVI
jgi:choline dehydrogenase-like flavoprotein